MHIRAGKSDVSGLDYVQTTPTHFDNGEVLKFALHIQRFHSFDGDRKRPQWQLNLFLLPKRLKSLACDQTDCLS